MGEYLRHVIISNKLLFVELCEYPFSEGLLYYLKVYLREPSEYAIYNARAFSFVNGSEGLLEKLLDYSRSLDRQIW